MLLSYIRCLYITSLLIFFILISIYMNSENNSYFKSNKFFFKKKLNSSSIQRAILVYFPSDQEIYFLSEIRWLYRSWIEMIKYEPKQWRTDFIIFTEKYSSSFIELGCIINQIRLNNNELPMCRIFIYLRIAYRNINFLTRQQNIFINNSKKEFFNINFLRSKLLYNYVRKYQYIDSVNVIAESYPIYSYYDFILKTDLDVFLTKQFGKFIPNTLNTLFIGQGGYSTNFNTRRLGRIAKDMNWKYQNLTNIGSTWYGSSDIAYHIANLTLDAILHLSLNEFCQVERDQKLGAMLWPDWHYGVLSMYGTHLAVNHLNNSNNIYIQNGDHLLDQLTTSSNQNDIEINNYLHLHCWHTDEQFSKFQFKNNKYNHINPNILINDTSARGYAMRMALESRLMTLNELKKHLHDISKNKILSL